MCNRFKDKNENPYNSILIVFKLSKCLLYLLKTRPSTIIILFGYDIIVVRYTYKKLIIGIAEHKEKNIRNLIIYQLIIYI